MSVTSAITPQHTVHHVFDATGPKPPFAYSAGLALRPGRAYELSVTGLPGRLAQAVINGAAKQLVNDALDPAEGLELDEVLQGGYLVRLRRAEDTSDCPYARVLGGADVPMWQILIPDKWGFYPGDSRYSDDPDAQPLM
ncbi:DUF4262 domain-containing protein (plasmid) [Streptomyces sp. NBC_00536]|uniref:DUF4262 domain-containing protein n=1 Tax=Streptomyces sp. NBC_00536 TaxID=2975769 RepID=UPI002E8007D4|nr:DUF4262 domain-containing protein [Streptomyces sp. NBC_00536]WUC84367.1 DUF4262 domain-containing protein [Streptomyces sp. NBC_00536]